MSSEEIKTIYKKLVQSYVDRIPHGNPLWVLNKHINAYSKDQWKTKEPAILDLALREGIEIPEVKELIEKGRTRKEAILEVSKNMKFQVSEREAEKWLKEVHVEALYEELLRYYSTQHTNPKEILYYRIKELQREGRTREEAILALYEEEKPGEAISRRKAQEAVEKQILEREKTLERLTILFSKGEINEESYRIGVKEIEKDMKNLRGGKRVSVTMPARTKPEKPYSYHAYMEPTKLWYLVPFFFGLLGGVVAYVGVKDEDRGMAENLLVLGFFMTVVYALLVYSYYMALFS